MARSRNLVIKQFCDSHISGSWSSVSDEELCSFRWWHDCASTTRDSFYLVVGAAHLSLRSIITRFLHLLSIYLISTTSGKYLRPMFVFFQTEIDVPLVAFVIVIPFHTRQTARPGGWIHELPSAATPHLTSNYVAVWLPWRPGRQGPAHRSGALWTMCLRRPGDGGLLWRVATLGEPHGLLFVWTRPPMPGCSLTVAEKNET